MPSTHHLRLVLSTLIFALLVACNGNKGADSAVSEVADFSVVVTDQGSIAGRASAGLLAFKGIPYAKPPVGELRWRAPQPVTQQPSLLNATEFGHRCMQRPLDKGGYAMEETPTQPESEDCLYLNVYRPNTNTSKLPVMVWIHGGGLVNGSGARPVNHGGKLAQKGVVVVTFNYRLGRFGFFAHPELSAQNPDNGRLFNYGIMDQIAALRWIQNNIEAFGGDPDNVTIFGESAGAYSVFALNTSPEASGLFHKAIAQSGYGGKGQIRTRSLANEGAMSAEDIGLAIAARLGKPEATLAELRNQSAKNIVDATNFANFILLAVDGKTFVDDMPASFERGTAYKIPMIIGSTEAEFTMIPPEAQLAGLKAFISDSVIAKMSRFFSNNNERDTFLYSDYVFHAQNLGIATAHQQAGNSVYRYRFAMPGLRSQALSLNGEAVSSAYHAGDMPYTFGNFTGHHNEATTPTAGQIKIADEMMSYWTNFAKTGNPNGEGLAEWPTANDGTVLRIGPEDISSNTDPWLERLATLNALLDDETP